jgi:hypothetical protein
LTAYHRIFKQDEGKLLLTIFLCKNSKPEGHRHMHIYTPRSQLVRRQKQKNITA